MALHILILAGGGGTRLWPLSRTSTPKHLLPLGPNGTTLLRATVERVHDLGDTVSVVTSASQAAACVRELQGLIPPQRVIAEPEARGTGPALGLATALLLREDAGAVVASVHADSRVGDVDAYRAALTASAGWAGARRGLATVGLKPASPATGMGYIELGAPLPRERWRPPAATTASTLRGLADAAASLPAFEAVRLVEKPDAATARAFVDGGRHLWNLGLFAWPATVFMEELEAADKRVASAVGRTVAARAAGREAAAAAEYGAMAPIAVEPLIFERSSRLTVVEANFPWSDLGSWGDLRIARVEIGEGDNDGNVVDGDVLLVDSERCTVESRGGRIVAVAGAEGLVVVDTPDALLVVPEAHAQRVKEVVDRLRAQGRGELL
jgi:mannose-1-phosphate guanylyltransferase